MSIEVFNWDKAGMDSLEREWTRLAGTEHDTVLGCYERAKDLDAPDKTILDVGIGTGRLAEFIRRARYIGVDAYDKPLIRCAAKGLDVRRGTVNMAGGIPLADASADVVISNAVLFHIGWIEEAVHELWRVTKTRLIFTARWQWWPLGDGLKLCGWDERIPGVPVHWTPINILPRWQVKRLASKVSPRPLRVRYQWHSQFVYVVMDKVF